ncbi:multidrug and toxin extrusion protein 1 [Lingula anatina]|uniref:Multidrug and toxin extrusion protein n=1 Tax=Lingula anatina TaxID=7574 RepID=A0A1S3JAI6_LINAN|nr:multidrug and toxin extrusion protein 1 [Lingula anatina]|eukprot:XP_013407412.1 multidrug and toxin extrusion protein 1 [Lingula anatina]
MERSEGEESEAESAIKPGTPASSPGAKWYKTFKHGSSDEDEEMDIKYEVVYKQREACCTGRCGVWHVIFPHGYKEEFVEELSLAWPMVVTFVFTYMFGPVAIMFCGHLGTAELDAVGLANSVINVLGVSIGAGMTTACDTLFAQTFGSTNKKRVGVYLQQGVIILSLLCFPCWALWVNIERLLILVGQDAEVSRLVGEYLMYFLPGLFFNFQFEIVAKYLQDQNKVFPTMVTGLVGNTVNAACHWLFVLQAGLGTRGSAIAQVIGYAVMLFSTLAYIWGSGLYKDTWDGWTWECFEDWGTFIKLGVPGLLMICIEWWSFEIGTILTGIVGKTELGVQSILFQLENFVYMVPMGIGVASSIRVGQALGGADPAGAVTASRVALSMVWVVALVMAGLMVALRWYFPLAFTNDPKVISLAADAIPVLAIFTVFDGTAAVCNGILRGAGKQTIGAIIIFVCYYIIGLPISIPVLFLTDLTVKGFWMGLAIALAVESLAAFIVVQCFTKWDKEVLKAQVRAGVIDEAAGDDQQVQERFQSDSEAEYSDYHSESEANRDSASPLLHTRRSRSRTRRPRSRCATQKRYMSPYTVLPDREVPEIKHGQLSKGQLIFRRTLAFLFSFALLGAGLAIRFCLPK